MDLHLRTAVDQSPLGTVIFDSDGRCLLVNAAWNALWHSGEIEVVEGSNVFESAAVKAIGLIPYLRKAMDDGEVVTPLLYYEPAQSGSGTQALAQSFHLSR